MDGGGQLGLFLCVESDGSRKAEGGAKHVLPRSHKSNTMDVHRVWHFVQDTRNPLHEEQNTSESEVQNFHRPCTVHYAISK